MPLYSFRCRKCGDFDVTYSMANCPMQEPCPMCNERSPKVISSSKLGFGNSLGMQLEESCRSTADNPPIIQGNLSKSISSHRTRQHNYARQVSISSHPLHHKLPRP